jgi:hypothetical protein
MRVYVKENEHCKTHKRLSCAGTSQRSVTWPKNGFLKNFPIAYEFECVNYKCLEKGEGRSEASSGSFVNVCSVTRMHPCLIIVLCLVLVISANGVPLVCSSRIDSAKLLHLACTESIPATYIFDIGTVSAAGDEDDLDYERMRVSAYAEWIGVMRPYGLRDIRGATTRKNNSKHLPRANTAALHLWLNTSVAALIDDSLTLWYMEEEITTENITAECTTLLSEATTNGIATRHERMLFIIHQMVMERILFDQHGPCPDMNERRMFDLITHKSKCICQQDKICGSSGTRLGVFVMVVLSLGVVLAVLTIGAVLYTSVMLLKDRAGATVIIAPRAQPIHWN